MLKTVLVVLLATALIVGGSARVLTAETTSVSQRAEGRALSEETVERQRILAELEELHQLRERMLQEGKLFVTPLYFSQRRICNMARTSVTIMTVCGSDSVTVTDIAQSVSECGKCVM